MEHLQKDEHYSEALRNIIRKCPLPINRKGLLLLLEKAAFTTVGKQSQCSAFFSSMSGIDSNTLLLWISEEVNVLKSARLESQLAPILDESPPTDDFLCNNMNQNNNFTNGHQMEQPRTEKHPSEEEYLYLTALKFDDLMSSDDDSVADLIDLNDIQPQPPTQPLMPIDPIENVKAHFNKNSNKEKQNTFPPNNFNAQIGTDLLSSFMEATNINNMNQSVNPPGFEPALRTTFPAAALPSVSIKTQQAFTFGPHSQHNGQLIQSLNPAAAQQQNTNITSQPRTSSLQQSGSIAPHQPSTPPGFLTNLRPPRSISQDQDPLLQSPIKLDSQSHIVFGTPEHQKAPLVEQSPLFLSDPPMNTPQSPKITPDPTLDHADTQVSPQNIFPVLRPRGTLPPPPGLPLPLPLPQTHTSTDRQDSSESDRTRNHSEPYHGSRHDSTGSFNSDHSYPRNDSQDLQEDYSITNLPNMESRLFRDVENTTDIMYQYKVVSQAQLESFVTNGEVKAQIRQLGVFYTISPCSDPNFFVISLSGTHKAVTKSMETLGPELTSKDTNYNCKTISINLSSTIDNSFTKKGYVLKMIKKLFPEVTIINTTSDSKTNQYQINGTKLKVDEAINMINFFISSPTKMFGICYRLHPILYESDERLEELRRMSAKITTHDFDKIVILGSSEAEGFKYLFVHGLANEDNHYKLQRYINTLVEKLEREAREEKSVKKQESVSATYRYTKEEMLKLREWATQPLEGLERCALGIVRICGVHARSAGGP